ncbi:MAG: PIN domain-containing protein [bacterium]
MKNNSKIIADTCIWIEFFRSKSEISESLKDFLSHNQVVVTGVILAELLQGVKTGKEREIIIDTFNFLEYIETTKELWIETGKLASELRSCGKTIPLSDIIIACCAKKYNYHIFTIDQHFKDIPEIKIL